LLLPLQVKYHNKQMSAKWKFALDKAQDIRQLGSQHEQSQSCMHLVEYSMQNGGMQIPYNVSLTIFVAYTVRFAVTTCRNNIPIHAKLRDIHDMGKHDV